MSLISFLVVVAKLTLCSLPLIVLSLIKLAVPAARPATYATMARIYRAAVIVDDRWLQRVVGVSWDRPQSRFFSLGQLPTTTAGLTDWLRSRWSLQDRRLHEVGLADGSED